MRQIAPKQPLFSLEGKGWSRKDGSINSSRELVLSISTSWSDLSVSSLGVKLHKLGEIELRLLKNLDLLDEDVLKWEDLGALLSDGLANGIVCTRKKYN